MAHTFQVTVTDEEYKALNLIVVDADQWVADAVTGKVWNSNLRALEMILSDLDVNLLPADKAALQQYLVDNDLVMVPWKKWPKALLKQIVEKTTLPSRVERDALETP
jgi:hypothetical protein